MKFEAMFIYCFSRKEAHYFAPIINSLNVFLKHIPRPTRWFPFVFSFCDGLVPIQTEPRVLHPLRRAGVRDVTTLWVGGWTRRAKP